MLNYIFMKGRLTAEPEIRTLGEESTALAKFRIAVSRKNKEGKYTADFFNCVAWNGLANIISAYKGLERIWQEGQINFEISEFARINYKDKTTLLALPLQDKQRILFEWQTRNSTEFADKKVKEYRDSEYLKRLPEVAEFMNMPLEELEKLSPGVKIQMCMCYDVGLEYLKSGEDMTEDDILVDLERFLKD